MASERTIGPDKEWALPSFRRIWESRELLLALTLRDVQIRYKQSLLGIGWAAVQPLLTMVVFSLIFGRVAKLPSDGLPYPVFTMVAILPWQFFQKSLTQGSISLVTLGGMMSKVYFPRLLAPLSSVLSGLIDFGIAFVILLGMMAWFGIVPGIGVLAVPALIALVILVSLSISLVLSGINVRYRDVQHTLPFLAQIWMYLTPVVYPLSMIPEQYRALYMLNPMVGVVEGFRWSLLGRPFSATVLELGVSAGVIAVLLVFSLLYFNRFEKSYVDAL